MERVVDKAGGVFRIDTVIGVDNQPETSAVEVICNAVGLCSAVLLKYLLSGHHEELLGFVVAEYFLE